MLKLPVKFPIVNENIDLSEYAKKSDVDAIGASLDNKADKKEVEKISSQIDEIKSMKITLIKDSAATPQEGINYVDMVTGTTINLPVVNKYTEIRLWFKCTEDLSIEFPEVVWQNEPETYAGYIYEYIFTYIPEFGTWVGGFVSYEMVGDN